jgi:tRNA threonylcarbamoyladenosine biosynthesis protein TsaB
VKLLALETSSATGSVALWTEAGVAVRTMPSPREQTDQLLAMTDELLRAAELAVADLDGIAFGRGPGSFTGLRVSVAVAQGLAAVARIPLLPVSSLLCLAERAWREHGCTRALLCIDAHMGEVYSAESAVAGDAIEIVGRERLAAPTEITVPAAGEWAAVGDGFAAHAALADLALGATQKLDKLRPSAEHLFPYAARDLIAGRGLAPGAALPVYLREQTAWKRSS